MQKIKKIFLILLLIATKYNGIAQQGCININNRIKYSFPYNGSMYVKPLTSTVNYIIGGLHEEPLDSAGILIKTSMDSTVWSLRYITSERRFDINEPNLLPNGNTVFTSGKYGDTNSCSLSCISPNGNILWAKKMAVNFSNNYIRSGSKLTISNNAIYFLSEASSFLNDSAFAIIAKLDFNGNIIWSKACGNSRSKAFVGSTPLMLQGDTLISVSNILYYNNFEIDSVAIVFTMINANTGVLFSSARLKTGFDNFIKGITAVESKTFSDSTISLSGQMAITHPLFPGRIFPASGNPFSIRLTKDLNKIKATYLSYNNNLSSRFDEQNFYTQINTNKETGYLLIDGNNRLGYFVNLDSNAIIQRSRVFSPQSTGSFLDGSFYFDDASTFYYSFPFNPNLHHTDLEYSRIGNLAEANTLDCFGNDTLVTTSNSFTTIKDTFSWDSQYNDVLTGTPVTVTTAPFIINKSVICTQTSICDTLKIKGSNIFCSNSTQTFTVHKNSQCLKKTIWQIDTSYMQVVAQPDDTTISLNLLKSFDGYVFASIEGCTLKDSFHIKVTNPKTLFSIKKDSLLCSGKNLTLQATKGFAQYRWPDGSGEDHYTITDTGFYKVIAVDSCGNTFKDSITVTFADTAFNVPAAVKICNTDTFKVQVPLYLTPINLQPALGATYANHQLLLYPAHTTAYTIIAETNNKCKTEKNILINVDNCAANIFFPNAFSPNGNSSNIFFKPFVTLPLQYYQLLIYNRFGQKVFESNSASIGWNGKYRDIAQAPATYIYYCSYKFFNKPATTQKGYCILLR